MRFIKLLPILILILLQACKLDPPHSSYSNVMIPIDERMVPKNAVVNTPLNISVRATAENGCWSNIHFRLEEKDERRYEIFALADFESYGDCPAIAVSGDTILKLTPSEPRNYFIKVWMSPTKYELDTIVVTVAPQGR